MKDVQIKSSKEECAEGMEQRPSDAAAKGVQTKSNVEECAGGMGQIALKIYCYCVWIRIRDDYRNSNLTQSVCF
eukprot:scaffold26474_cov156-Skeletonema_marinoi.AAC.2